MTKNKGWEREFDKKWARIAKTITGHISGRKIWDIDPEDEDSYAYVDETLKSFIRSLLKQERQRIVGEIRESAVKIVKESRAVFFGKVDRAIGEGTYEMKAQIFSDLFENEKSPLVFPKFSAHLKERER